MFRAIPVLASLAVVLSMSNQQLSADERTLDKISVTGQGKVTAPPDMAAINTGVVTQGATAREALSANNEAMQQLMGVLKEHHVAGKDVQTSNFNVHPVYKHDPQGRKQPEITGYRVQNQVSVKVRNLPDLGEVLDALVSGGSNQISGVSFGVDDETGLLNQARSRAISDARSRAGVYAQAAGVKVGRVRTISEQPVVSPQPMRMEFASMRADAAQVPVATGELEFGVTVNVVFDLSSDEDGT